MTDAALPEGERTKGDLNFNYLACAAERREDWLRLPAHDNYMPPVVVQQLADELCKRKDFGELVPLCKCGWSIAS